MIKKTITYTDYEGVERTENHYFNFTKPELMEMAVSPVGGLEKTIQKITEEQDVRGQIEIFKDLILKSYGEKSADGRRFVKSKELSEAFSQTEAYTQLFMELVEDANKAAEFIIGTLPSDMQKDEALVDKLSSFK